MKDHFIKNKTIRKCIACNNNLEDKPWHSEWELNQHYKTCTCQECGKKIWVKVCFEGSGDDNWKPGEEE